MSYLSVVCRVSTTVFRSTTAVNSQICTECCILPCLVCVGNTCRRILIGHSSVPVLCRGSSSQASIMLGRDESVIYLADFGDHPLHACPPSEACELQSAGSCGVDVDNSALLLLSTLFALRTDEKVKQGCKHFGCVSQLLVFALVYTRCAHSRCAH